MKTRRFMTLALALCLCLGLALPAAAADMGKVEATNVVSSGDRFTAFIDENGTLWTCGSNRYGQLGIGTHGSGAGSDVPVRVMDGVASVSCGATLPPSSRRTTPCGWRETAITASWATAPTRT